MVVGTAIAAVWLAMAGAGATARAMGLVVKVGVDQEAATALEGRGSVAVDDPAEVLAGRVALAKEAAGMVMGVAGEGMEEEPMVEEHVAEVQTEEMAVVAKAARVTEMAMKVGVRQEGGRR